MASPLDSKSLLVGVILPDDGPFDYEWLRLSSWLEAGPLQGVRCVVDRSPADGLMIPENLMAIGTETALTPSAKRLANNGAHVIAWACTSGSFVGGRDRALTQVDEIKRVSGLPATSTSVALAEATLSIGAGEVDLLSAYDDVVTELLVGFIREYGIKVVEVRSLGCVHSEDSFAIDLVHEVTAFAANSVSGRLILIPDTAINSLEILPDVKRAACRPVVTANQATLWHSLKRAGYPIGDPLSAFDCEALA
jgi:maleate cis-trans isomerase